MLQQEDALAQLMVLQQDVLDQLMMLLNAPGVCAALFLGLRGSVLGSARLCFGLLFGPPRTLGLRGSLLAPSS